MSQVTNTFVNDLNQTIQQAYNVTVASSTITVAFAAIPGYFWVITKLSCANDKTGALVYKSNATQLWSEPLPSSSANALRESNPVTSIGEHAGPGFYSFTGVAGTPNHDLTLIMDCTTTGIVNATAVALPARSFTGFGSVSTSA